MAAPVGLYAILKFDYIAPAGASCLFYTDEPGEALAQRGPTLVFPAQSTRRTIKFRLPSTTKGKLFQVIVTSEGTTILFEGWVFARAIGENSDWAWRPLPIPPTALTFQQIKLPIPPTSDDWTQVKLPIPPTSDDWTQVKLPIDPTADIFSEVKVPMHPTPELYEWLDVPTGA
jgi:hypothetical protein